MRLWAISDLHVSHAINREAFKDIPSHHRDWLIVAGDIADKLEHVEEAFALLTRRFAKVIWVPGNHELWTVPREDETLKGVARYEALVALASRYGVVSPEDPYPVFPHPFGSLVIVPLFLLYDYSFRPSTVAFDDVIAWAKAAKNVASDEFLLHPTPYPSRQAWCAVRCAQTETRLERELDGRPCVLINHWPLKQELAVLPRAPRFTPWCGTTRSENWAERFNAQAVVYGHLHIRRTERINNIPHQEVSLGYPKQWDQAKGIGAYLREVKLSGD